MKQISKCLLLGAVMTLTLPVTAQGKGVTDTAEDSLTAQKPFKGHFYCPETKVNLYLDLYEESLEVPGFGFLGKMKGYMEGGIYGTWMLISHEATDDRRKVKLRFSNDIGSDSQNIEFTQLTDSTFQYQAVDGNAVKKAIGRKLVKVTDRMKFVRK